MRIEDTLRETFARRVSDVRPAPDAWHALEEAHEHRSSRTMGGKWATISLSVLLFAGATTALWVAFRPSQATRHKGSATSPLTAPNPQIAADIPLDRTPAGVAANESGVWIALPDEGTSTPDALVRIDPDSNQIEATVRLPQAGYDVIAGYGAIWVSAVAGDAGRVVYRVDPSTNQIVATIPNAGGYMAVGAGSVWTSGTDDQEGRTSSVSRIDPQSNQTIATLPLDTPAPFIRFGEDALWAVVPSDGSNPQAGDVLRIDPETNGIAADIKVGAAPDEIALGGGFVWVEGSSSPESPVVIRIDAETNEVVGQPVQIQGSFAPLGLDETGVWFLSNSEGGSIQHLNEETLQVDGGVQLQQAPAFGLPPSAVLDSGRRSIWIADSQNAITRVEY